MRMAHDVGMQRDAHDPSLLRTLRPEGVEVVGDHPRELLAPEGVAPDHRVVDLHLVAHRDEAAAAHAHPRRLLVVAPVALIGTPALANDVAAVVVAAGGRRAPAPGRPPRDAPERFL